VTNQLRAVLSVAVLMALADAQDAKPNASGGVLIKEQACYDVCHYDLSLSIDPVQKSIDGVLRMTARAIGDCARIALDLDGALIVRDVSVDSAQAKYEHLAGRIFITPALAPAKDENFIVAVTYGGVPRVAANPPWTGGFTWQQTKDGKPWIATTCQGEGADLWWPCKDHPSDKPATFDLHFTVPKGLLVASNGTLQKDEPQADGRHTCHWQVAAPISNYSIALNIGPYEIVTDTYESIDGTKVPVQFFALPQNAAKARKILPQFLDHVRVFEELLGPYPFRSEKYGVVETPHLGMEHQTIIAYGNGYKDMRYDWLHNHELSHEWFGNLITCSDWRDMWLHESFGTYMQPLYLEKRQGAKAYEIEMRKNAHFVNQIAIAPRESMDSHQIYFANGGSNDIYFKGCWVLHTLRWQMGDAQFFESLRRFCYPTAAALKATDGSQCRMVETEDYVRLCSEIAGQDLGWFFEVYVRQPKLPMLEHSVTGGKLTLRWLTPNSLPFDLPVEVQLADRRVRVLMPKGVGELAVGDVTPKVDPDSRILMSRE
jgi:aminopeptidase N